MAAAFLIVGLGNPGPKYAETRHNAGFWFLDALLEGQGAVLKSSPRIKAESARLSLYGRDCIVLRPTGFMNRSGFSVRAAIDYFKASPAEMLIAYDDLDLSPGDVRLKKGGGHGGHNGLRDVFRHIEEREFLRLRIGIGHPGNRDAVTRYVLGRSPRQIREVVDSAISRAVSVMPKVLEGRVQEAMTQLHTGNQ